MRRSGDYGVPANESGPPKLDPTKWRKVDDCTWLQIEDIERSIEADKASVEVDAALSHS